MIETVKLNKLRLSPINVRKVGDELLRLDELTPEIEARGILANLLVTPAKPRGTYEILDGGRRYRALLRLVAEGKIDAAEYDVPVNSIKGDEATLSETSFAATHHHLPLTAAEEVRAYQHFIGKGADIDAVAKRFGQTRRHVEGRLRLAALAEPIFDALSSGAISLDVAKAYASTESHDKQLRAWEAYGNQSYQNADTIRRQIATDTLNATDPIATLVGETRYRAAGGEVDGDLFSETGDRWINPEIAHRLAGEIMEAAAKTIGAETGLAWIRPIASSYTQNHAQGLHRVRLPLPDLTDEQEARLLAIDARRDELQAIMESEAASQDERKAADEEDDVLIAEASAINDRAPVLPDELKPYVGLFLTLSPQGELRLDTIYYSEQPIRRVEDEPVTGGDEREGGTNAEGGQSDDRDVDDGTEHLPGGFLIGDEPRGSGLPPEAVGPGGKPISARLFDQLAMQRRDILAASLLAHPGLALDYALFTMIDARINPGNGAKYGSTIRANGPQDPTSNDAPASRARAYLAGVHDGLDAEWTELPTEVDRFEAFRAMSDDSRAAWLAYVVAISLEAKPGNSNEQIPLQNRLASIMEINVCDWWRPTADNFFDRVNKSTILSVLNDVGGGALMARHATLKKTEISTSCEKLFAGDAIVEPAVKEAALAWVPDTMRFLDKQTALEKPASGEPTLFGDPGTGDPANPVVIDEPSAKPEAEMIAA